MLNGEKMSSRNPDGTEKTEEEKAVFYAKNILEMLDGMFHDRSLSYNVLAGEILKSDPKTVKNVDATTLMNPNISFGLYISYTTARMKSADIEPLCNEHFVDFDIAHAHMRALNEKAPSHLFMAVLNHCMKINTLYKTHQIKGNAENKKMFTDLMMDLELGLKLLGMFSVDKVLKESDPTT